MPPQECQQIVISFASGAFEFEDLKAAVITASSSKSEAMVLVMVCSVVREFPSYPYLSFQAVGGDSKAANSYSKTVVNLSHIFCLT